MAGGSHQPPDGTQNYPDLISRGACALHSTYFIPLGGTCCETVKTRQISEHVQLDLQEL